MNFSEDEYARHLYIVGKTGMGKSTLLEHLAIDAIKAGRGVCFVDFHGDSAAKILGHIPKHRTNEVCDFDLSSTTHSVQFNPLAQVPPELQYTTADNMTAGFEDIWENSWGERLSWFLFNAIHLLLEKQDATLRDIRPLFFDKDFRLRATGVVHRARAWLVPESCGRSAADSESRGG